MRKTLSLLIIVFVICLVSLPLAAQNNVVVIDHMCLPEGGGTDYLEVEQKNLETCPSRIYQSRKIPLLMYPLNPHIQN